MKIRDSIYNAGNDYPQWVLSYGGSPVPPGPVPPGPVPPGPGPIPPGPTPPGPTPAHSVSITLSITGNKLSINATGDIEYIDGYIIDIFDTAGALVKSYKTTAEIFDLSDAQSVLPPDTYTVKVKAYNNDGTVFEESGSIIWVCTIPLPACDPMTLRFKFNKADYAPVDSETGTAVTTKGTWTKLDAGDDNIWDWTYDDPDWTKAFQNVFNDETNLVDIIDAGDTSGVTKCSWLFDNNLSTGQPDEQSYIRSCCLFDTSNVTSMDRMFKANHNLQSVPLFNTSKVTDMTNMFMFCESLVELPTFDTSKVTSMNGMLGYCSSLTSVPQFNTDSVTDTRNLYYECSSLTEIPVIDIRNTYDITRMFYSCSGLTKLPLLNLQNVDTMYLTFSLCKSVTEIPQFNTSNVSNFYGAFNGMQSLRIIPQLDYSNAVNIERILGVNNPDLAPQNLESLPDISTLTEKLTNCTAAFKNIRNVKYGILDTYNILKACNPTDYAECFLNCGIDTEEGRAQLYQIPQEWGGLKPNISITFKFHNASYNPAEHQLGVGKAVTGEDRYEQKNKKFSAEWVCLDQTQNIWLWCVTEGTNLSSAFVYGDGTGTGVPMLSGKDYITGIPEELTLVEDGTREYLMQKADEWKYGTIDQADWVPEFEIIDWDLENATDITAIIGTNVWFKNNLVGTLPALRSTSISNMGYAFDRCWNITSMGPINLPNCSQGANNAFMSMMGLTEIPTIEAYHSTSQLNNTFNGCLHASKESIEDAFEVLSSGNHTATHNCFKMCGKQEDPTALENIPVSWGGEAIILGTNVNGNITPLAAGGQIIKF